MTVIIINFDYNIVVSKSSKKENKFKLGTNHAEVRGTQRAKKLDEVVEAKQFCSHLACPSCQTIQNREKILNGTGYCADNNYVYSRDYTHLDN